MQKKRESLGEKEGRKNLGGRESVETYRKCKT